MGALGQLGLLIWKNILVQRRSLVWTAAEILLPTLLSGIMLWLRQNVDSTHAPSTNYTTFGVAGAYRDFLDPSNGTLAPSNIWRLCFVPHIVYYAPNTTLINDLVQCKLKIGSTCFDTLPNLDAQMEASYIIRHEMENVTLPGNMTLPTFKFIGVPDEETLVEKLMQRFTEHAQCNNEYLGGIVFTGEMSTAESLSEVSEVSYKIRLGNVRRNDARNTGKGANFLRFDQSKGWDTERKYPLAMKLGPRQKGDNDGGVPGYWREGFLSLQHAVNLVPLAQCRLVLMTRATWNGSASWVGRAGDYIPKINVTMRRFSYPAYVDNQFITSFQSFFPFILMVSLVVSVLYITRNIVHEKEKKLKEYMRVMGLRGWLHWLAHFATNYAKLTVTMVLVTALLCTPIQGKAAVEQSDFTLIFAFLMLYAVCTVWFAFAVSTFFRSGNAAAACAGIAWFVTFVPYLYLQPHYTELSFGAKMGSAVLLNTAMAWGAQIIGIFEGEGRGMRWSLLGEPVGVDDNLCMLHVFAMLLVDLLLLVLLTCYLDAVLPGDQGVPQKWYFPVLPSYWCGARVRPVALSSKRAVHIINTLSSGNVDSGQCEPHPMGLQPSITIENLTKTYTLSSGKSQVHAVVGLNLSMFPGQITALLGHNGAGKSTTMAMLTGTVEPSSGTAFINGYDIRTSVAAVRRKLGLCAQYNALFDQLTVLEHLELFCKLKERPYDEKEVAYLLFHLNLTKKKHSLASTLSGGMKRKLSVAIALVGKSEVVMLDEPTSGMDPSARHEAWSLLQAEKQRGRTLLLTTHHMEEADALGDRIAILAHGTLQCAGSAMYLKGLYGAGYHVTLVFDKTAKGGGKEAQGRPRTVIEGANAVLDLMRSYSSGVRLASTVGLEATYLLPAADRPVFERLFAHLERTQTELGVSSFGVSLATMEEVFLTVCRIADTRAAAAEARSRLQQPSGTVDLAASSTRDLGLHEDSDHDHLEGIDGVHVDKENAEEKALRLRLAAMRGGRRSTGLSLWFKQLHAMLVKRGLHAVRNYKILLAQGILHCLGIVHKSVVHITRKSQIVSPVVFILLAMGNNELLPSAHDSAPLQLDLSRWPAMRVGLRMDDVSDLCERVYANATWCIQFMSRADQVLASYENFVETGPVGLDDHHPIPERVNSNETYDDFVLNGHKSLGSISFLKRYMVGADVRWDTVEYRNGTKHTSLYDIEALFNNQPYHMPGVALSFADNALAAFFSRLANRTSPLRITTVNHPLPPSATDRLTDWFASGFKEYNIAFNMVFGMAFTAASMVVFLVKERETKSKHLQFLAGVHPFSYWLATAISDMLAYSVTVVLILGVLKGFGQHEVMDDGRWLVTLMLLYLYAWAILPMSYAASFVFSTPAEGFVKMAILMLITGLTTLTLNSILFMLDLDFLRRVLEWSWIAIIPSYTLGQGFNVFYINEFMRSQCAPIMPHCAEYYNLTHESQVITHDAPIPCCADEPPYTNNTMQWYDPGIGRLPTFFILQGLFYWALICLVEMDTLRPARYQIGSTLGSVWKDVRRAVSRFRKLIECKGSDDQLEEGGEGQQPSCSNQSSEQLESVVEDMDVINERQRIAGTPSKWHEEVLLVKNLTKYYGNFLVGLDRRKVVLNVDIDV